MNLSTEEQKLLTEWLGECWHEEGTPTGMVYHPYRCAKCIKPIHAGGPSRLDFSDWRVVGRIVEKVRSLHIASDYLCKVFSNAIFFSDNPQLAICRAILAYLQEGEK